VSRNVFDVGFFQVSGAEELAAALSGMALSWNGQWLSEAVWRASGSLESGARVRCHHAQRRRGPRPPKRAGAKLTEETCPAPKPEPGPIKPEAAKVKPKPKRDPDAGRLPDGAEFTAKYDAKAKRWTGKLTIGDAVFDSTASGVFRLMINLDASYRASIGTRAAPVTA
jgi:hypothetical protein